MKKPHKFKHVFNFNEKDCKEADSNLVIKLVKEGEDWVLDIDISDVLCYLVPKIRLRDLTDYPNGTPRISKLYEIHETRRSCRLGMLPVDWDETYDD